MNIEAYDLESLREMVRLFEYELDQGARIVHSTFVSEKMAIRSFPMYGEEKMSMPCVVRRAVVFRSVKEDGMLNFVQSSAVRGGEFR